MIKKSNKTEAKKEINKFFKDLKNKKENKIKRIKRLAMRYNIKLGDKRKKFCKKCFSVKLKTISIRKGIKTVRCENCKNTFRWKVK